jgi:hypothetical protein
MRGLTHALTHTAGKFIRVRMSIIFQPDLTQRIQRFFLTFLSGAPANSMPKRYYRAPSYAASARMTGTPSQSFSAHLAELGV